jgi:predicted aspartyl protease
MSQSTYRLARLGDMLAMRVAIGNPSLGSKVMRLLVDTGSAYTVFPPDLLPDMGCDLNLPARRVKVVTAGGIIQAPIVILPWMNFLGQRFEQVPVMAHTVSFGTFTSGLLGMDVLRRCGAVIHTRRAVIQLDLT